MNLLKVEGLEVDIHTRKGVITALHEIDLELNERESLCLVGESGCGKTMVALSIMRLLPDNMMPSGAIIFKGNNILRSQQKEMRAIRGKEMSMIFEQPSTCLNPVITIGDQIAETVKIHQKCSNSAARKRSVELLSMVGLDAAAKRYSQYPHEFSGGMQQRVMIAIALANNPSLLIADEPTTSLDASVQLQIVKLLRELTIEFNSSLLLITHDLSIANRLCNNVAVMYAGEIVEKGKATSVFTHPVHPYTRALISAARSSEPVIVKGQVPELTQLPGGCRFHPRCAQATALCLFVRPSFNNGVRCHQ